MPARSLHRQARRAPPLLHPHLEGQPGRLAGLPDRGGYTQIPPRAAPGRVPASAGPNEPALRQTLAHALLGGVQ